jgi:hypothetical protein
MLYFIANHTTINKTRLDARIKRDFELEDFVFVRLGKSNRLKSSAQKRQLIIWRGWQVLARVADGIGAEVEIGALDLKQMLVVVSRTRRSGCPWPPSRTRHGEAAAES